MRRELLVSVVLATAAGGMSVTIAKARLFEAARTAIQRRTSWGGLLVTCPYCVLHWLVFAGVAYYRPRLLHSRSALIDLAVTAFAIIALGAVVARITCDLFWGGR